MNNYITGKMIKELRENKRITQSSLAKMINVSDKTISKWETGKGLPDISLLSPLATSLGVSIIELMNGEYITNKNKSSNMSKCNFYVCPICGNIFHSVGEGIVSCCGITLPNLIVEEDDDNIINIEKIDNEYYISINHEMNKEHYISFIAYVTTDRLEIVKLYPESACEALFQIRGLGQIYAYCNKDGLIRKKI